MVEQFPGRGIHVPADLSDDQRAAGFARLRTAIVEESSRILEETGQRFIGVILIDDVGMSGVTSRILPTDLAQFLERVIVDLREDGPEKWHSKPEDATIDR